MNEMAAQEKKFQKTLEALNKSSEGLDKNFGNLIKNTSYERFAVGGLGLNSLANMVGGFVQTGANMMMPGLSQGLGPAKQMMAAQQAAYGGLQFLGHIPVVGGIFRGIREALMQTEQWDVKQAAAAYGQQQTVSTAGEQVGIVGDIQQKSIQSQLGIPQPILNYQSSMMAITNRENTLAARRKEMDQLKDNFWNAKHTIYNYENFTERELQEKGEPQVSYAQVEEARSRKQTFPAEYHAIQQSIEAQEKITGNSEVNRLAKIANKEMANKEMFDLIFSQRGTAEGWGVANMPLNPALVMYNVQKENMKI